MKRLLQVHLSEKCNLRCKHCYQKGNDYSSLLNISDFGILMSQFKEISNRTNCSGRVLNITGGEPLIIPNILEYIDSSISSGVEHINLLTNGLLLDEYMVKELKQRKIIEVQLSIEGTRQVNNSIRGNNTYDKILDKINLAHNLGLDLKVSYTLNGLNWNCIEDVVADVKNAGARLIWFDRMIPFSNQNIPVITTQQFITALCDIKKCQSIYQDDFFRVLNKRGLQFMVNDNIQECYRCGAVVRGFSVLPNGDVLPCRRMPIKLGNFKKQSLLEIYVSCKTQNLMSKIINPPKDCEVCNYSKSCRGGLKCLTYAVTGDINKMDINCPVRGFLQNGD